MTRLGCSCGRSLVWHLTTEVEPFQGWWRVWVMAVKLTKNCDMNFKENPDE